MIVEGLVVTAGDDGTPHLAPMGPRADWLGRRLVLRPYQGSTTGENLLRSRRGVFHLTDDVELLARAAIHQFDAMPAVVPVADTLNWRLADCCAWYAFDVIEVDQTPPRLTLTAQIRGEGRVRDWRGMNRAQNAVLEAAILATRVGILPAGEIRRQLEQVAPWVPKTAGPTEQRAWQLLEHWIETRLSETSRDEPPLT